jgi:hypothetical protein
MSTGKLVVVEGGQVAVQLQAKSEITFNANPDAVVSFARFLGPVRGLVVVR